jgi:hypothetical protein
MRCVAACFTALTLIAVMACAALASPAKSHSVGLGAVRKVPYSVAGDPAGAGPDETELPIRPLVVDGKVKEWATGQAHDVTDRSLPCAALCVSMTHCRKIKRSTGCGSAVRGC